MVDWYNTDWNNRRTHLISKATGASANYVIPIKVYKSSTGSGTEVFEGDTFGYIKLDGKCQDNFGDIRFTASNGTTLLPYWIQEYTSGDNAIFWVNCGDCATADVTIYIYYNASVTKTTTSNGANTFTTFFEDFEGTIDWTNKWQSSNQALYAIDTGTLKMTHGAGSGADKIETKATIATGYAVFCKEKCAHASGQLYGGDVNTTAGTYGGKELDIIDWYHGNYVGFYVAGVGATATFTKDTTLWMRHKKWNPASGNATESGYEVNGTQIGTKASTPTYRSGHIGWFENLQDYGYLDDVAIRPYVSPEPAHSTWGDEENQGPTAFSKTINEILGMFDTAYQTGKTWYDKSWGYRKIHYIGGSTGAGTGYQIPITVHYGSGTDSAGDVYCNSHCNTDFSDIRFASSDAITMLDYWLESKTDSTSAYIWVEVTDSLEVGAYIYIYYGNASATTASSGDNTFAFFDDFNNGTTINTNKWDVTGTVTQGSGKITCGPTGSDGAKQILQKAANYPYLNRPYAFRMSGYFGVIAQYIYFGATKDANWNRDTTMHWTYGYLQQNATNYEYGGGSTGMNALHIYDILWTSTNTKFYQDGVLKYTGSLYMPSDALGLGASAYSAGGTVILDWVLARHYVYPEPANGFWGTEEPVPSSASHLKSVIEVLGLLDTIKSLDIKYCSELFGLKDIAKTSIHGFHKTIDEILAMADMRGVVMRIIELLGMVDVKSAKTKHKIDELLAMTDTKTSVVSKLINEILDMAVEENWWNASWLYRKSHVITHASGAGTNYQIPITVHYGSGTDNGENVYCNSNCKTDFGDIRFIASDDITLLDYWMESKTDSDNAVFWVEIAADLSTNDQTIYIYYGNSGATTTSNGDNTFLLFDDFSQDGGVINSTKWTTSGPNVNIIDGKLVCVGGASVSYLLQKAANYPFWNDNVRFRHKTHLSISNPVSEIYLYVGMTHDNAFTHLGLYPHSRYGAYTENASGNEHLGSDGTATVDHIYDIGYLSGTSVKYVKDGATYVIHTTYPPNDAQGFFASAITNGQSCTVSWVAITKFVSSEPVNSTWGIELTKQIGVIAFVTKIIDEMLGAVDKESSMHRVATLIFSEILGLTDISPKNSIIKVLTELLGAKDSKSAETVHDIVERLAMLDSKRSVYGQKRIISEIMGLLDSKMSLLIHRYMVAEILGLIDLTTKFEYHDINDDTSLDIYDTHWGSQTFTVGTAHSITSVRLKMFRIGDVGTLTLHVKAVDEAGDPTGDDLTSGTFDVSAITTDTSGDWYMVYVIEIPLSAYTKYAIVLSSDGTDASNCVAVRLDSDYSFAGGNVAYSTDSGSTWTDYSNNDMMFEVWGNSLAVQHHGNALELIGLLESQRHPVSRYRTITQILSMLDIPIQKLSKKEISEILASLDSSTRLKGYHKVIVEVIGATESSHQLKDVFLIGVTRDSNGTPVGNCEVWLFRTIDKTFIESTLSDVDGNFSFEVEENVEYWIMAWKPNSPNIQGTTDRNLKRDP